MCTAVLLLLHVHVAWHALQQQVGAKQSSTM
jgi:hypothetical protein